MLNCIKTAKSGIAFMNKAALARTYLEYLFQFLESYLGRTFINIQQVSKAGQPLCEVFESIVI